MVRLVPSPYLLRMQYRLMKALPPMHRPEPFMKLTRFFISTPNLRTIMDDHFVHLVDMSRFIQTKRFITPPPRTCIPNPSIITTEINDPHSNEEILDTCEPIISVEFKAALFLEKVIVSILESSSSGDHRYRQSHQNLKAFHLWDEATKHPRNRWVVTNSSMRKSKKATLDIGVDPIPNRFNQSVPIASIADLTRTKSWIKILTMMFG